VKNIVKGLVSVFFRVAGQIKPHYTCIVCDQKIPRFFKISSYFEREWKKYGFAYDYDDFETLNAAHYSCPICFSNDRDRLIILYLKRMSDTTKSLLEVAPSYALKRYFKKNPNYVSCDLKRTDVDIQCDITNMSVIKNESFDIVICSHVLEHVENDREALEELFRVLKPQGTCLILVPILKKNYEENIPKSNILLSDSERWKFFGQRDHLRNYSQKSLITLINKTCFGIELFMPREEECIKFGIKEKSVLYVLKKV